MGDVGLIMYGRGGSLGNFEVFAKSLATQLQSVGKRFVLERVERRARFFELLTAPPFAPASKIGELHIFTHSIGGGLFLAYGDAAIQERRKRALEEIEKRHRGHWVTSAKYKAALGEWPSGVLVHRLHPDRGEYHAYHP